MTVNFYNASLGLSLLSTSSAPTLTTGPLAAGSAASAVASESLAARKARAAFTTPPTTPPWLAPANSLKSPRLAQIRQMASVVDSRTETGQPKDVQTAFTTYKALERLTVVASAATAKTLAESERSALQDVFAKGLADLQSFLGQVRPDKLTIAFTKPVRQQQTASIPQHSFTGTVQAKPVATVRDAPLAGISGQETLRLSLQKGTGAVDLDVALSGISGPVTLDNVAAALNDAIARSPAPQDFTSRFAVAKTDGKWGLVLNGPAGETISIDQPDAGNALMVVTGARNADGSPTGLQVYRADAQAIDAGRTRLAAIYANAQDGSAQVRNLLTDPDGNTYAIGSASGVVGANIGTGQTDSYLTKLDSEGRVVWQRSLGATVGAEGAALARTAEGDLVITGTMTGDLAGKENNDSDIFVARFNAAGEEEFARTYRMLGNQRANAVAVDPSGAIFIGGQSGDDGFVTRLDAAGNVLERMVLEDTGSESVTSLAFDATGDLLVLGKHDQTALLHRLNPAQLSAPGATLDLGVMEASAIAVDPADGAIVIGGTSTAGSTGGVDAVVTLVAASFDTVRSVRIASDGADRIDSVALLDGQVYIGGRTSGSLGGTRSGRIDGFYGQIDMASGTVTSLVQFGAPDQETDAVRVAAQSGGNSILGALGLHRGALNSADSLSLVAQTSLRAGDSFSIRVGSGLARKVTIAENETLASLAGKIRSAGGYNLAITTPKGRADGDLSIRIAAKAGHPVELIAGPQGQDALAKLGLEPARLSVPVASKEGSPLVQPGGQYGLALSTQLNLKSAASAKAALDAVTAAVSMTKTAYRSLYWDSTKAALVDGSTSSTLSAVQQARLDQYTSALQRLTLLTQSS